MGNAADEMSEYIRENIQKRRLVVVVKKWSETRVGKKHEKLHTKYFIIYLKFSLQVCMVWYAYLMKFLEENHQICPVLI